MTSHTRPRAHRLRGALAAASLALLATPVLAQPPAPDAPHRAGAERMHEMMEKHRQAMAADLHAILNIRPDQEQAFAAFQAAMAPPPRPDRGARRGEGKDWAAQNESMTTPQRLDRMLARMDERAAMMRKRIEATKTFYAALSPQQQQAFDALMRLRGGHGERGMSHGWGGPGKGGWGGKGDMPPPPPPGE